MARIFEPTQERAIPIIKKFSKDKFLKYAQQGIKLNLGSHIDTLDGMEVDFTDDDRYGTIENYIHEGTEYYLYPVYREWCE